MNLVAVFLLLRVQCFLMANCSIFCTRDVDDVHEMMDDIQEQTELADEISRAISEPAGFGMDFDEVSRQSLQYRYTLG